MSFSACSFTPLIPSFWNFRIKNDGAQRNTHHCCQSIHRTGRAELFRLCCDIQHRITSGLERGKNYLVRVSVVKERHPPSNVSETCSAGVSGGTYVFHAPDVSITASRPFSLVIASVLRVLDRVRSLRTRTLRTGYIQDCLIFLRHLWELPTPVLVVIDQTVWQAYSLGICLCGFFGSTSERSELRCSFRLTFLDGGTESLDHDT